MDGFKQRARKENNRAANVMTQLRNQHASVLRQWRATKMFFTGEHGAWHVGLVGLLFIPLQWFQPFFGGLGTCPHRKIEPKWCIFRSFEVTYCLLARGPPRTDATALSYNLLKTSLIKEIWTNNFVAGCRISQIVVIVVQC